ncbi:MAG: hypothetical protein FWE16_00615 [Firmicutes bacterium]|nr:hypothetical protein [Bacillota bacterium]
MTRRRRNLFLSLIGLKILIGVGIAIYFIFFTMNRELGVIRISSPSDMYRQVDNTEGSRLLVERNGTFAIQIFYNGQSRFTGIGTHERSGGYIHFTFIDAWVAEPSGEEFTMVQYPSFINETISFRVQGQRTVRFVDNHDNVFYFR